MFMRYLALLTGKISGWKVKGPTPQEEKFVIIGAPHSTNWDLYFAMMVKFTRRIPMNFLIKDSVFKPPIGWFIRLLGGLPVDRSKSQNLVQATIETAKREKHFALAIAPEGTRTKGNAFKMGFYHIALGAGIPLILAGVDYPNKIIQLSGPIMLTGDRDRDLQQVFDFYRPFSAKNGQKVIIPEDFQGTVAK